MKNISLITVYIPHYRDNDNRNVMSSCYVVWRWHHKGWDLSYHVQITSSSGLIYHHENILFWLNAQIDKHVVFKLVSCCMWCLSLNLHMIMYACYLVPPISYRCDSLFLILLHELSTTNTLCQGCGYHCLQWPLLLTWFNFNPSMDK